MVAAAWLTERGILDSQDVFVAVVVLSLAVGLLVGRWWALAIPPALAASAFAGIAADLWGAGFGERWGRVFVGLTAIAGFACAAAIVLHRAFREMLARRLSTPGRTWQAGVAAAAVVTLAVLWYAATRPPKVSDLQDAPKLYYLGDSFEGYRLVHAEASQGRALFAYGDCESPVGYIDGGCSVPLQLQETFPGGSESPACAPRPERARRSDADPAALVAVAGSTTIEIYAHEPAQGRRAARALRPVSRSCA